MGGIILLIFYLLFFLNGCSSPFSPDRSPEVVYVDINNTTGKEDGSSAYPFRSISKAVTYAGEGATIIVRPGHYYEADITMKRGQKLQGSGAENTIIERAGHDLIILRSGCEVSGFYIKSQWSGTILGPAIYGENVENIQIFNNKFYYADSGAIRLEKASGRIFNNVLEDPRKALGGIGVDYSENIEIFKNHFKNFYTAIIMAGASPKIYQNVITNCRVGIDIGWAVGDVPSSPSIYENTIENNDEYGIRIRPYPTEADLGGGKRGSPGGNVIRNNGKYDLLNESPSEIYAQNNTWTHSTEEEIDKFDICDDDEGKGGKVIFVPFKKE